MARVGGDSAGKRFKGKLGMAVRKTIKVETAGIDLAAHAALPPSARWLLEERFLATVWYPLDGAPELLEAVARVRGQPIDEVAQRIGRRVAHENAGAIGRTLLSLFGTPERLARYFGAIWSQTYDSGQVEGFHDAAEGRVRVRLSRWMGHHPTICMTVLGTLEALAMGIREPKLASCARVRCVSHGAPHCEYQLCFGR